ncbi:MAG: hypothetical protein IT562_01400 [Alphaproteobacteria bacterium]|nr:hypothetical protein [Alphaproteobacteria bacterium]
MIADAAVAALLAVTIGYAVLLSRRLRAWRDSAGDMVRQVESLNDALSRASQAVETLKAAGRDEAAALDAAQRKAQSLRDDLSYLVERGTGLADRLEKSVRGGLGTAPPKAEAPRAPGARPSAANASAADRTVSSAERELMKALEAMR